MDTLARLRRFWQPFETLVFWGVFAWLYYLTCAGLVEYLGQTAGGKGFIKDFAEPWYKRDYQASVVAVIWLVISLITVWEILRVWIDAWRANADAADGRARLAATMRKVVRSLKPTFLASAFGGVISKLLVLDIFWALQSHLAKLALFHVPYTVLGWLYGLLIWDLATWTYHFSVHRVRLLWCMHAPHHAPEDLTITTAWVHFFAEGWFTTTVQLLVLTILGVPAAMLTVFIAFEVSWGTLIHTGERVLPTGRLGPLHRFLMTPSYHRVHHAKNPIYMDTNFCTLLPVVDWLMGTLQPLRDEVRPQYGITRPMDVAKFGDFYFGEFVSLWRDVRQAKGWRERLGYLFRAPGWSPTGLEHTAAVQREAYLAAHPDLRVRGPRGVDAWFRRRGGAGARRLASG